VPYSLLPLPLYCVWVVRRIGSQRMGQAKVGASRKKRHGRAKTRKPFQTAESGSALDARGRATEGDDAKREWFDRAIAAYEQSLTRRPDDAATLDNLTASLLRCWRVTEDREERAELLAAAERTSLQARALALEKAHYNYCCVLALQNRQEPALTELKELLQKRPDRKKDVAEDPDFEPLSGLVEFQRLIEPYPWQPDPTR
jgi:tetratricopeptide (TPR) repeat protein